MQNDRLTVLVEKAETDVTTKNFLIDMEDIMEKCYECHDSKFFGELSLQFRNGQLNHIRINKTIKPAHTVT